MLTLNWRTIVVDVSGDSFLIRIECSYPNYRERKASRRPFLLLRNTFETVVKGIEQL